MTDTGRSKPSLGKPVHDPHESAGLGSSEGSPPGVPGPERDWGAGEGGDTDGSGERSARLPVAPPLGTLPIVVEAPPAPDRQPTGRGLEAKSRREAELTPRPSRLAALTQSRTTLYEVGEIARRLSMLAPGLADAKRTVRQASISFAVGLTLVLLVTLLFAGGTWRLAVGVLGGTAATSLVVFASLRLVSRLASRHGARQLPGPALLWVGGVVLLAAAATVGFTLSIWEVTKPATAAPWLRPAPSSARIARDPEADSIERADATMKRGVQVPMSDGVLYAPPHFASADGQFDLVIHYHGNVELIEQSIVAAGVNALVRIINFGESSGRYSKPLQNPTVFDAMLGGIESRAEQGLGLKSPQIRRIALSSWSAGFGALGQILNSRSRLDRVDAVLLMDSLHASFAPGSDREVYIGGLKPFITFARRAAAGQKLMVLSHSAIETEGYASTTQTADALLASVSLERKVVVGDRGSLPVVDLSVARRAFPTGERNWLRVASKVEQGGFHLYGCSGNGRGDHIAHLAQMSVTMLPPLVRRWQ